MRKKVFPLVCCYHTFLPILSLPLCILYSITFFDHDCLYAHPKYALTLGKKKGKRKVVPVAVPTLPLTPNPHDSSLALHR